VRRDGCGPRRQAARAGKATLRQRAQNALEHDLHLVFVIHIALQHAAKRPVDHRMQSIVQSLRRPIGACQ
jgi:hypothetical protein